MEQRNARASGPAINPIGLGCMGMSEFYGEADDERSMNVIHRAVDAGAMLDTADMYGSGANEELVGRAIADRRQRTFLATKFALMRGEGGSFDGINGRPEYLKKACEDSLKRLGVDHIDLYYQHRVDPEVPIEETVGAMGELVKEGKVRFLGLSEASADTVRRAHATHPISALQTELSLWSRGPEKQLLPLCKELGILFVAYSPLGRGFLTGRYRSRADFPENDFRLGMPRFSEENFDKNLKLADAVAALAEKKGCTTAQLALAWVLSRGSHVVTIPGTTHMQRLEQNLGAAEVSLGDAELAALDEILPPEAATGTRYPESRMAMLDD